MISCSFLSLLKIAKWLKIFVEKHILQLLVISLNMNLIM